MVAVQQPAESFMDEDVTDSVRRLCIDQLVAETLVRSLGVMMGDVLTEHALEVARPEQDHPVPA